MTWKNLTPQNTEFVILSFEGPDPYSFAGGLAVRIENLSTTLAKMGFVTHLFFIGDAARPGEEVLDKGRVTLHRWCQWISRYHPGGVYDGEEGKVNDFNDSVPRFVADRIVRPAIAEGKMVVVMGEEWQTAEAMCRLGELLGTQGTRDRVLMFWNANNTFGFNRIDWQRLSSVATITTVSRYMKHVMWQLGLNPLVIPNGIPRSSLRKVDDRVADGLKQALGADLMLCKVARWDPDKRWNQAVEAAARLKDMGVKTVLVARGGAEPYGDEVIQKARDLGLKVREAKTGQGSPDGYIPALVKAAPADIIDVRTHLPLDFLKVLYRASDGVLANSGHEPFGLVGLETMAAGGVAFTGGSGEDYAIPHVNSVVLETGDPTEIVAQVINLRANPDEDRRIRRAGRLTARFFTWESVTRNLICKIENQARVQELVVGHAKPPPLALLEVDDDEQGPIDLNGAWQPSEPPDKITQTSWGIVA